MKPAPTPGARTSPNSATVATPIASRPARRLHRDESESAYRSGADDRYGRWVSVSADGRRAPACVSQVFVIGQAMSSGRWRASAARCAARSPRFDGHRAPASIPAGRASIARPAGVSGRHQVVGLPAVYSQTSKKFDRSWPEIRSLRAMNSSVVAVP